MTKNLAPKITARVDSFSTGFSYFLIHQPSEEMKFRVNSHDSAGKNLGSGFFDTRGEAFRHLAKLPK